MALSHYFSSKLYSAIYPRVPTIITRNVCLADILVNFCRFFQWVMYSVYQTSIVPFSLYRNWVPVDVLCNPLQWRHNGLDSVSNHQSHDCLLNLLFRRRSKKTSKLRVTALCAGKSPVTGEFPAQMASNAENCSIWWRHHAEDCNNESLVMKLSRWVLLQRKWK